MRRGVLLLALLAFGLSACGKRPHTLDPPPGAPHVLYPKHYPPPDDPGTHL